jgi:sialate O-acetylesterase
MGICMALGAPPAFADVHLPSVESDNMMLQAGSPHLYGSATPGEDIKIDYGSKRHAEVRADASGHWRVQIGPLRAGEIFDIAINGKNIVNIKNVLVGQVWLCSGQSNMEFPVNRGLDSAHELATANHTNLRLFAAKRQIATAPAFDVDGSWKVCDPKSVADFSAVGYFFGRDLSRDLKTPVGLIESAWGGTPAQAWTSIDGLESDPVTQKRYWTMAKEQLTHLHEMSEKYDKEMAEWTEAVKKATIAKVGPEKAAADKTITTDEVVTKALENKAAMAPPPGKSQELIYPHAPSMLYNGMIAPLVGTTVCGVIWYQGESNASAADETMAYRRLFPVLISDWRKKFGLPNLPFLFVQIANYDKREDPNVRSPWAEIREAQLLTLNLPNTGMAVAVDVGEEKDIHPKNKQEVGRRLELIALAKVYGHHNSFSGPIFSGMTVRGNKAVCAFKFTDRGLKTRDKGPLVGFVMSGADKKFVAADAVVSGNTVIVSSAAVSKPTAVRYAWAGDPLNNLVNGAGLPASPFRSDIQPEPPIVDLPLTK